MHHSCSQAAGAVTREGAEVLCPAHPLLRDHSSLSSAKGAVQGLPGAAGPPQAGRTCAAGLAPILSLHKSTSTPPAKTTQWAALKLMQGQQPQKHNPCSGRAPTLGVGMFYHSVNYQETLQLQHVLSSGNSKAGSMQSQGRLSNWQLQLKAEGK